MRSPSLYLSQSASRRVTHEQVVRSEDPGDHIKTSLQISSPLFYSPVNLTLTSHLFAFALTQAICLQLSNLNNIAQLSIPTPHISNFFTMADTTKTEKAAPILLDDAGKVYHILLSYIGLIL
jgi:hypothetical protein